MGNPDGLWLVMFFCLKLPQTNVEIKGLEWLSLFFRHHDWASCPIVS